VLVVDYPPEECEEFAAAMRAAGIDPIFLLAPTSTDERIEAVARHASGYLYYVSLKGITGAGISTRRRAWRPGCRDPARDRRAGGRRLRHSRRATARSVAEVADAVVIGTRIIQEIESAARRGGGGRGALRGRHPGSARCDAPVKAAA
jgi:tryptophan synthase alpha chain